MWKTTIKRDSEGAKLWITLWKVCITCCIYGLLSKNYKNLTQFASFFWQHSLNGKRKIVNGFSARGSE